MKKVPAGLKFGRNFFIIKIVPQTVNGVANGKGVYEPAKPINLVLILE